MALVIAHRGSHESVPENTLAAFDAAADNGAEMIEFDVRRTADGALAIFHDSEIARTALNKLTLEELRRASGVDVPVLEDVLSWAREAGMGLDVELKEDGYVEKIAPLLAAFDGPVIVTSFIDPVLAQLADLLPDIHRGLLFSMTAMRAAQRVTACRAHTAVVEMKLVSDAVLAELANAELGIYAWDVVPHRDSDWLENDLIGGFITDDVPGTRSGLTIP